MALWPPSLLFQLLSWHRISVSTPQSVLCFNTGCPGVLEESRKFQEAVEPGSQGQVIIVCP